MKNFFTLLFSAILFLATPANAQWVQTNGPTGGPIYCMATVGGYIFSSGDEGIFRSSDNGSSWEAARTGIGMNYKINTLVVDGTNLYAGVNGGVFRTTNNGTSWTYIISTAYSVTAIAINGTSFYVAGNVNSGGGIVSYSSNSGSSWVDIGSTTNKINAITVNGLNVFIATTGEIAFTNNNGTNWYSASSGLTNTDVRALVFYSGNLFAGTNGSGVFRSTDNGASWTAVNGFGLPKYNKVQLLAVVDSVLIACTSSGGVFQLSSISMTWQNIGLTTNSNVYSATLSGTNLYVGTQEDIFHYTGFGTQWVAYSNGLTANLSFINLIVKGSNLFVNSGDGIFCSTNNGVHWTAVNTGLPKWQLDTTRYSVRNLIAFGNYLFVTSNDDSSIYFSTDNGDDWNKINYHFPGPFFGFSVIGTNLYAHSLKLGSVFLSTDSGSSWNEVVWSTFSGKYVRRIAVSGTNLLAVTSDYRIYRSTNNGSSWPFWVSIGTGSAASFYTNGNKVFFCCGDNKVYTSTNNGTSWSQISGLPTTNWSESYSSVIIKDTNIFVAAQQGIYLSTDNGTIWGAINSGFPGSNSINSDSFVIKDSILFVSAQGGVYVYTGAGSSNWSKTNSNLKNVTIRALASYETNIFAGTDKGIFRSSDNGSSWNATNTVFTDTTRVYCFDKANYGLVAGTSEGIYYYNSSGNYWQRTYDSLLQQPIYALAINGDNIFTGINGGFRLRKNYGGDWHWTSFIGTATSFAFVDTNVFVGTNSNGVWQLWQDTDTLWFHSRKISSGLTNMNIQSLVICGTNLFAGTYGGGIFRSTYLDTNWYSVNSGLTDTLINELAVVGTDIFASGDYAHVFHSTDNGESWNEMNANPPMSSVFSFAINGSNLFAGTYGNSVFVTDVLSALPVELFSFNASVQGLNAELKWKIQTEVNNYGFEVERSAERSRSTTEAGVSTSLNAQWTKVGFVEGNGTSNAPKEYSFTDKNLKTGKYSYRLKQIDRDGKFEYSQTVEVEIGNTPKTFALAQNYPNPFNPTTTINYQLPQNSLVTLKVFDVLGKEVASLVNEEKSAGSYEVKFDASKLSSGIYFYRLQARQTDGGSSTGNFTATKKLLLMK